MRAADTSLVVAAFASWHEHHEAARAELDAGLRLIEHCAIETYSVLTRLPPPHRVPGTVVRVFVETRFPDPFLRLGARAFRAFVLELAANGVTGGAAYDALVAATAAGSGVELVTCDRRALPLYQRYGVRARLVP